jgi:hypothetical protein
MAVGASITRRLEGAHPALFGLYAVFASFTVYFCMYAIRKPFSAGTYPEEILLPIVGGIQLKILYVISQLFGYTLSKFLGIKVVSEMTSGKRALVLMGMLAAALVALLLFAITPAPWSAGFLFLNGIPLGMVWGLVFSFLEGRRTTEALAAGLSASYVLADGAVKTAGRMILDQGVSEAWMPFVTGLCFFPALTLAVWLLQLLPPPTPDDEAARVKREPMDGAQRWAFFKSNMPGLVALMGLHVLLTAFRDFNSNFEREVWDAIGYADAPEVFATSKIPIALGVLVALGSLFVIKDNRRALNAVHAVMLTGGAMVGLSTAAFQAELIGPATWMITVGLGLYLAYVPFGSALFERMIAALGMAGNAGFLIYLVDAFGYLGSVGVNLYKNFGARDMSYLEFFISFSYLTSAVCVVCFGFSMVFFARKAAAAERSRGA